jgi:hypothetical protein
MSLPPELQRAFDALTSNHGATEPALRRGVLEFARSGSDTLLHLHGPELLSAGESPDSGVRRNNLREDTLRKFLDKVADRPWTITDEDVTRLCTQWHSEDLIFELTLACALGAGLRRFDAGLRSLEKAEAP